MSKIKMHYTLAEAALFLQIEESAVQNLVRSNRLKAWGTRKAVIFMGGELEVLRSMSPFPALPRPNTVEYGH